MRCRRGTGCIRCCQGSGTAEQGGCGPGGGAANLAENWAAQRVGCRFQGRTEAKENCGGGQGGRAKAVKVRVGAACTTIAGAAAAGCGVSGVSNSSGSISRNPTCVLGNPHPRAPHQHLKQQRRRQARRAPACSAGRQGHASMQAQRAPKGPATCRQASRQVLRHPRKVSRSSSQPRRKGKALERALRMLRRTGP